MPMRWLAKRRPGPGLTDGIWQVVQVFCLVRVVGLCAGVAWQDLQTAS